MIELPLIFLGGLLGSAHCVGMCGGFALMVAGGARSLRNNLLRQLAYSGGRIFTYAACGATLGYAGLRLAVDLPSVIHVQAVLAITAGVLLVLQGLMSAGVLSYRPWHALVAALSSSHGSSALHQISPPTVSGCLAMGGLAGLLRGTWPRVFLAGTITGFLPCGLVYTYLALATSSGDFFSGLATMIAFGLGTVPLMVLFGGGVSWISPMTRHRLLRVAAWCVVITGLLSLARGVTALQLDDGQAAENCPFCE